MDLSNLFIQSGFAGLFVWLLWDTRRESRKREEKLISIINKLTGELPKIRSGIEKINNHLGIGDEAENDS